MASNANAAATSVALATSQNSRRSFAPHLCLHSATKEKRFISPSPPKPPRGHGSHQIRAMVMKIERFAGHHEAREALVLSVAGVTAIMLIESLSLLILY